MFKVPMAFLPLKNFFFFEVTKSPKVYSIALTSTLNYLSETTSVNELKGDLLRSLSPLEPRFIAIQIRGDGIKEGGLMGGYG
jgi:hypothetical protein